jgi:hypothetical protein
MRKEGGDAMAKATTLIVVWLLLIPAVGIAADTQLAVFGIAPASTSVCVAPGENVTVNFMFSSTSPFEENFTSGAINNSWVATPPLFVAQPKGQTPFTIIAAPPEDLVEGNYSTRILICSSKIPQGDISVETCLAPSLSIEVSKACTTAEQKGLPMWLIGGGIAAACAVILAVWALYRRKRAR